jgi:hypothetical protein
MIRLGIQCGVAAVAIAFSAIAIVGSADQDLSALAQRLDRLQALTERVEAISAVKRLQHAYGHYSEVGLWHDFADLFADAGVGHYPVGDLDRESIRKLFLQDVGGGRLGLADGRIYPHIVMQPVVTVAADGASAKGRWHVMAMLGGFGTTASWAGGVYENEYVRERGVWKLKDVRYLGQYGGRYEDPGWTATNTPTPFHYDAQRVGHPILEVRPAPRSGATPTLDTLNPQLADLAARVQRMSDEIEVTNLQHAYGYYVDRKMWDDVADLFAIDGTMELGQQGVYAGRASIRRGLNQFGPQGLREGELNDHIQLQTIVTILPDGRSARARGTEIAMVGVNGRSALWNQSTFENAFVKQNGVWKIKTLRLYPRFIVDAEKGWAKDARPAPGPISAIRPDRPPSEKYEIYPKFHIAPFHFVNPVTGRPAQYPPGAKAPARPAAVVPVSPPSIRSAANLDAILAATELAVERVLGYHASENLTSAYGYYIDEFKWDDTADIFSRDGWKELSYVGTYVGRERIRQSLKLRYPNGKSPTFLTLHQIVQPVIHVSSDGRSARIRVRPFQLGGPAGGEGSWIGGIYENTSVHEDGAWKLSGMDLDYIWTAPSRGGWARVKSAPVPPDVAMAKEFPPDRPLRGPSAAPFPKVVDVPFHYKNPVSGRTPPLLLP